MLLGPGFGCIHDGLCLMHDGISSYAARQDERERAHGEGRLPFDLRHCKQGSVLLREYVV